MISKNINLLGNKKIKICISSLRIKFRDKEISIDNLESLDVEPYIGAKLTFEDATKLKDFLEESLLSAKNSCEFCCYYEIDKNIDIQGKIICKICKNEIKIKKDIFL